MMRRQPAAFAPSEQHLLEALADYASISLVNAHLFRSAEERARALQSRRITPRLGEQINNDILQAVKNELAAPVETAAAALAKLGKDPTARWRPDQRQLLTAIQDQLEALRHPGETRSPRLQLAHVRRQARPQTNLNDLVRQTVRRVAALHPGGTG